MNAGERLERDGRERTLGQFAAEVVPVAATSERRGPDRATEVEGEDLRLLIAAKLQGHQRQQHRLAGAGRTDDQRMADIADVEGEAERSRAFGSAEEQGRRRQMLVLVRSRPHRRQRDHVGEVQGRDRRLPDIGVDVTGQAAEPGIRCVDGLGHRGEVAALDHLLDESQLLVGEAWILVPDGDGGGDIGLADQVGAEFLQGQIGIGGLVGGVAVDERRRLVGHHLLQNGGDRLPLGEPLPPDLRQQPHGFGLVEQHRPRRPTISEGEPVQLVEYSGRGRRRESDDRQHAQVRVTQLWFEPAGQRLVGEQRVEIHRRLGDADAVPIGRNGRVEIGQRLGVIEPGAFGHEAGDELQDPVRPVDKAVQELARIHAALCLALIEPALRPRGVLGRRQVEKREEVTRLEVGAFLLEVGPALGVDQGRRRIGKGAGRIAAGRMALRFDEDRPTRAEAAEGVVQTPGDCDQLGRHGAVEVGTAEAS